MRNKLLDLIKQHPRLVVAQDFEIACQRSKVQRVQHENGKLVVESKEETWWVQLKVIHRNKPGVAVASALTEGTIDRLVNDALLSAEQSHPDPWFRFPLWSGKQGLMDADDSSVPPPAFWDSLASQVVGGFRRLMEKYEWWEVETNLFRRSEKGEKRDFVTAAFQQWGLDNIHEGCWGDVNRLERVTHLKKLAEVFQQESLDQAPSGAGMFSLSPRALAPLLQHTAHWFLGSSLRNKRGPFHLEDLNTQVFSGRVRLLDDSKRIQTPFSGLFDLDGIGSQKTALIEGGVLKGFIYDSYYGGMENCRSTGNSLRLPDEMEPKLSYKTICLEPGPESPQKLWAQAGQGLWLEGWSSLEFLDETRFRGEAYGWRMDRGDRIRPVKYSGGPWDLLQLWKNIEAVGADPVPCGWAVAPTVFVRGAL